jgi:hypothetical protein
VTGDEDYSASDPAVDSCSQNLVKEQIMVLQAVMACQLGSVDAQIQDFKLVPKHQLYNAALYFIQLYKIDLSDVALANNFFFCQKIQMGPLMSKVEKLLVDGSPKTIKLLMPIYLRGITRITIEGQMKIDETIKKLDFVIQVLEQLISENQATFNVANLTEASEASLLVSTASDTEKEQFQSEEAIKRQVMLIIKKGLKALAEMRDGWNNLRMSFSMMYNTLQSKLGAQVVALSKALNPEILYLKTEWNDKTTDGSSLSWPGENKKRQSSS